MRIAFALVLLGVSAGSAPAQDLRSYPDVKLDEDAAKIVWVSATAEAGGDGSEARPYPTINGALEKARAESIIVIREGTYRERIDLRRSRKPAPKAIVGYPGETVAINGMKAVAGWKPYRGNIHVARIDWEPKRLYVGYNEQQLARHPREGWWRAAKAKGDEIECRQLKGLTLSLADTQAYVWTQHGNVFHSLPLVGLDGRSGKTTVQLTSKWARLKTGDKFYLQNNVKFIQRPGDWAYEKDADGYKVYFYPKSKDDLGLAQIPHERRSVVGISSCDGLLLAGVDVVGGLREGIYVSRSKNVKVRWCRAFLNNRHGIAVRSSQDVEITNNISWCNSPAGIAVTYSKNALVAENEVALNGVDGIIVSWKTDGATVARNYVHHHLFWGHPDNIQTYRDLRNARFVDNLLLAGGQSVMTEQTVRAEFRGNMLVGCGANMLICGHKNAGEYKIHRNTFAFSGYGCISFTWRDYDVRDNIFMNGHRKIIFGVKGVEGYRGAHNVFWNAQGLSRKSLLNSDEGWHKDLAGFQEATGQDKDSIEGDPRFRNAPVLFNVLNSNRLDECTADRLYLRYGAEGMAAGDFIELNFDGVRRRVKTAEKDAIVIEPALKAKPVKCWLVANWKQNENFELDLRPAAGSPALDSAGKQTAGSSIVIEDYRQCDFDGDGRRDAPRVPSELLRYGDRLK